MAAPLLPFVILLFFFVLQTRGQGDFSCDSSRPCSNGACCGPSGFCGYGPDFCGTGCVSNVKIYSFNIMPIECGQFAATPNLTCPLNVCCSQFGFCGTTSECNGCLTPAPKQCSGGNSALQRIIGYYESWATARPCSAWWPEQLNPNAFTHINFAFASIDGDSFRIVPASPSDVDLYTRTTALKQFNPDFQVFISVGGWAFNDPPTQNIFSDLAANSNNRQAFINSLISFLQTYAFDGIDIDWEYPVAPERGGSSQDKENFVTLLRELRMAFDMNLGLTITIPSSYWYMQNFDIVAMSQYLDWFNAMEYDLHGTWDGTDPSIGPVVNAHSNLTEIEQSFDLLWRNSIDPSKVVMGLGFYGRSFQLATPSCSSPGCNFAGPSNAGPCTGSPGTLSYSEIQDIISEKNLTATWDRTAAVKYIVWNNDQWVSYDDKDTFGQKLDFANNLCLGGVMVWSADEDDSVGTAIASLAGNAPQLECRGQRNCHYCQLK
ncbi:glycoside hydrolase family 18 protein [Sphaerobolus stellatus SS14]|uniref:Glycoside hydrolase family 18 protein n=1 Tax=Sphaerobolus stellatus (strain SS14) TaxID=990650 RepID=A0A0C9TCV8_SPHS4|nr:glycoside hydrolase family 18 protein [Sphaerobolus stellatus SS14]